MGNGIHDPAMFDAAQRFEFGDSCCIEDLAASASAVAGGPLRILDGSSNLGWVARPGAPCEGPCTEGAGGQSHPGAPRSSWAPHPQSTALVQTHNSGTRSIMRFTQHMSLGLSSFHQRRNLAPNRPTWGLIEKRRQTTDESVTASTEAWPMRTWCKCARHWGWSWHTQQAACRQARESWMHGKLMASPSGCHAVTSM